MDLPEDKKENLGSEADDISRTAWEVQRFPYDVIGEINDQELLYKTG